MSSAPNESLDELIVRMDERTALARIRERLEAGEDPAALVEECRTGMERVGRLYEEGTYFISALIMAGEIIREAAELLFPRMETTQSDASGGKMVIATVRGDIHDIGKNIVIALLDADGLTMVDLGVNVPPEQIAEAVERERPDRPWTLMSADVRLRGHARDDRPRAEAVGRLAPPPAHRPRRRGDRRDGQGEARSRCLVRRCGPRARRREGAPGLNARRRGPSRAPAAVSAPDPESAQGRRANVTPARRTSCRRRSWP